MKKLFSLLLVVALLVSALAVTAFAAERGDEVTVSFSISGNPGFANFRAELSYNSDALELKSFADGAILSNGLSSPNPGRNTFGWMRTSDVTANGVLFTATFKVKETAAAGTYPVTVAITAASNAAAEKVTLNVSGGSVTVTVPHTHEWSTTMSKDENNHWFACSGCEEKKDLEAHDWTVVSTTAATCIQKGETSYKCNDCGATKSETIDMVAHTYGSWTKADENNHKKTCTTPGCTETLTEAHKWDAGKVTTAATCSEDGEMTYTCATCNATKTEVIKANGEHVYTNWTKVDDEKHEGTCGCGEKTTAAHKWDAGKDTTAATCSKPGVKTYTCSECKGTKTEEIAATGKHDYTNSYKDNGDGTHTAYCACKEAKTGKHDFSVQGPITVKPTTSSEGKQTILCACGAKTEKTLPQLSADMDDVPMTGDITAQVTLAVVSMISLAAAAAYVFKRKIAK